MNGLFGDVSGVGTGAQPTVPQSPFSAPQGITNNSFGSAWAAPAKLPSHFNIQSGIYGLAPEAAASPVDQQRDDIAQALMAQPMSAASVTPATPAVPTTSPATPAAPSAQPGVDMSGMLGHQLSTSLAQVGNGASTWQPEWGRPQSSSVNTTTGADILGRAPQASQGSQGSHGLGDLQRLMQGISGAQYNPQAYGAGGRPAATPGWDPRSGPPGQGTV